MKLYEITNKDQTLCICIDSEYPDKVRISSYDIRNRGEGFDSQKHETVKYITSKKEYLSLLFHKYEGIISRKYLKELFPGYKIKRAI